MINATIPIVFRAEPKFLKMIEMQAEKEKRSKANLLRKIILEYCEAKKNEKK